jgi:HAD superfamily hydrolase (TIGR01457 family)
MTSLNEIQCFLLDMDGTFYLGNTLIDGAKDFLKVLKEQGKQFIFLTNNSSKNSREYQKKLEAMGCSVGGDRVFTSGEATILYLNKETPQARIFLMGTPLLEQEFAEAGFKLVNGTEEKPDYVVLGFDTTLTYDKLWRACDLIREGTPYIATHPDFNCPLEGGKFMPDTGSMIKLIEASTGVLPMVIGKPNRYIVDTLLEKYGLERENVAMVGDRLYTDIKTGENAGITSILVFSGETTEEMYQESSIMASYTFPSIKELMGSIR